MRKGTLIVFSGPHIRYSPSTLNLFYYMRRRGFQPTLLAAEPEDSWFSAAKRLNDPDVVYVKTNPIPEEGLISRLGRKLVNRWRPPDRFELARRNLRCPRATAFIEQIERLNPGIIIAVDSFSLWCVQEAGRSAHLLSLELLETDPYLGNCDVSRIESVLIQSRERFDFLFSGKRLPRFVMFPNSPAFLDFVPSYSGRSRTELVYCGTAVAEFGFFSCLDFIVDFPEYHLTVKGALPESTRAGVQQFYSDIVDKGLVTIDEEYLDTLTLTYYLDRFRIGFAFYDSYRFPIQRTFNYLYAPSGKMFQYLNAGVPVVANVLPGFKLLQQAQAGYLVKTLSSQQIKTALDAIESNYVEVASNAKRLSAEFNSDSYLDEWIASLNPEGSSALLVSQDRSDGSVLVEERL